MGKCCSRLAAAKPMAEYRESLIKTSRFSVSVTHLLATFLAGSTKIIYSLA